MKRIFVLIACFTMLFASCQNNEVQNPILTIEGGQVQGVSTQTQGVIVYKGIPFAAPPIGENRWKAPQPIIPWQGIKVCDKFGHPAFQAAHYPGGYTTEWGYGDESAYSEDCLYLNVYTKASNEPEKKLPVAFWIFGGGLREGWGSEPEFDGQEFAAKDVVLVTFNYRVGPFGFFAHPDLIAEAGEKASGNFGTLDQIEALKWVKKNISQFGGDPENVMIFGQSAGSRSVKTLCASPLAKGLFNKAVIMSGNGLALDSDPEPAAGTFAFPKIAPLTLAEAAEQIKEVTDWANLKTIEDLRKASTETIFSLGTIYQRVTGKKSPLTASPIQPFVEDYVLKKTFDAACLDKSLAEVPYMIGFTQHDAGNMQQQIENFCLNRQEQGGEAYAYQFARPLPDDGSHPEDYLKGAFHSSDLWYVFKSLKNCWRPWTSGDYDLSEKMQSHWVNFCKYGNPNLPNDNTWQAFSKENPNFMLFKLDENNQEASIMGKPLGKE